MDFRSDNVAGAAPEIMAALMEANKGDVSSYGADPWSLKLDAAFSALFEHECKVFPVATGTAANVLSLSCIAPGYGAIYCHQDAHIVTDECNAPEFFTGGAKLVTLPGENGKIDVAALDAALSLGWAGSQHNPQPSAVSITQATEAGTVYSVDEVAAIAERCKRHNMKLHMDGARFANAVAGLNVAPADLTWRAGVDVLSFGATKNGAMGVEAVVFFKPELAESFLYRRKRGAHLFSKARFLSVQLLAMLDNGLWLRLAREANARARELADGLGNLPGAKVIWPVQANEVFVQLPAAAADAMRKRGALFHTWSEADSLYRFVCAFDKTRDDTAALVQAASAALK
ncbi:low specificity L-threonine aldolase [Ferrovibrio terrae]|uniref:L-threonine aldolase n=1 Tax=Ferrovibrio terrae TaxID=2594003 RepID=A0A516GYJ3_9PROT|nr:low specificity L-threonine aldolase [Ferrovibrio terrae]QDO96562.1 low specificity L-threonine aldolase [Ferrovibrio terrae]